MSDAVAVADAEIDANFTNKNPTLSVLYSLDDAELKMPGLPGTDTPDMPLM